jgi:hypothetical protein
MSTLKAERALGVFAGPTTKKRRTTMTNHLSSAVLETSIEPFVPDQDELAAVAVAFLARSGRTLDAYRHDLRNLRYAHIDGRITSSPAPYVRRPTVHPSERSRLDRSELGPVPFHRGALRPHPRPSPIIKSAARPM